MVCLQFDASPSSLKQRGVTLIELILVIVLIGVLGVGVTRFITASVEGYVDTATRQQLAGSAVTAAERMSREIRNALPSSIRINAAQSCVEFIPVMYASNYVSVPTTLAANSFQAVGGLTSGLTGRISVYPISVTTLYDPGIDTAITSLDATYPAGGGEVTITLGGNHQFPTDSPQRRFFLTSQPVAFCQVGARIYRFANYGFNDPASLPPSTDTTDGDVLLTGLATGSVVFDYNPASLVRNAVVNFTYTLQRKGESYSLEQEVNIRNVP